MLYVIFYKLLGINLFKYITFRAIYASLTAMVLGFFLFPWFKEKLKDFQFEQTLKEYLPETHKRKKSIPTMGGIFIISIFILSSVLWTRVDNIFVLLSLLTVIGFGAIGFLDDFIKSRLHNPEGLSERKKFVLQVSVAFLVALILYWSGFSTRIYFPVFKNLSLDLGLFFVLWAVFVIVGSSNAVNLTDGLDGLAIGPVILTSLVFLIYSYVTGNVKIASYLQIPFVNGVGELAIVCSIVIGASLVFLWFNTYPAEVFMGDVGSLSLGALLGVVSVMTKGEFILAIAGGVFVLETLSVIVQRYYYKYTKKRLGKGKRVFRMAPLHHHFEKLGWEEPKITVRFWIISAILALISLSLLKIR